MEENLPLPFSQLEGGVKCKKGSNGSRHYKKICFFCFICKEIV